MSTSEELFKKYSLTKEQISLFSKLRAEFSVDYVSDVKLIMVLCAKKKYEKCLKSVKGLAEMNKEFGMGDGETLNSLYQSNKFVKNIIDNVPIYYLKERTKDDIGIIWCDFGSWIPATNKEDRMVILKVLLKMFESLLLSHPSNVTKGVMFIADCKNFGWSNFDFNIEKMAATMFNRMAMRLKHMIMINSPWWIWLIWNLLKPFYSKKLQERFLVISPEKYLERFGKECCMKHLGGDLTINYTEFVKNELKITAYEGTDIVGSKQIENKEKLTDTEVMNKMKTEFNVEVTTDQIEELKKKEK